MLLLQSYVSVAFTDCHVSFVLCVCDSVSVGVRWGGGGECDMSVPECIIFIIKVFSTVGDNDYF